jgi:glycosyltransferase involved in cell wall biosynthesis
MKVSAYIPCFNNRETLPKVIASVRAQTVPVDDLFVVDDGSTDDSVALFESVGVESLRQSGNLGRGAARARAMKRSKGDFVLCVDATNLLPPDFLARALRWFDDAKVAAVFGRISQRPARNAVERWRGRHLFKLDVPFTVKHRAALITYGTLVRKAAVEAVGGFDPLLKHSEDSDLGHRLAAANWDVVFDPSLHVISIAHNTLPEVLERYWRWYAGKDERISWKDYCKQIMYSAKVMAHQDFQAGDPLGIPISLLSPHYQFWKSSWRRFLRARHS